MTALPLIDAVTSARSPKADGPIAKDQIDLPDFAALVVAEVAVDRPLVVTGSDLPALENMVAPDASDVDIAIAEVMRLASESDKKPQAESMQATVRKPLTGVENSDVVISKSALSVDPKEKETAKVVSIAQAVVQGKMPIGMPGGAEKTDAPIVPLLKADVAGGLTTIPVETKAGDLRQSQTMSEPPRPIPNHALPVSTLTDREVAQQRIRDLDSGLPREDAKLQVALEPKISPVVQNGSGPTPAMAPILKDAQKQFAVVVGDGLEVMPSLPVTDRVATTSTASIMAAPTAHGSETARHAAQQMASAVVQQHGRMTEIALNPEELGRVRLIMTAVDAAITLTVAAERPETADLLRRHIDVLTQEFRALGYEDVSFSFGDDGQADAEQGGHHDGFAADTSDLDETLLPPAITPMTGLDLRL